MEIYEISRARKGINMSYDEIKSASRQYTHREGTRREETNREERHREETRREETHREETHREETHREVMILLLSKIII